MIFGIIVVSLSVGLFGCTVENKQDDVMTNEKTEVMVDEKAIYLDHSVGRDKHVSTQQLTVGETVKIGTYGELTLDSYEITDDTYGSNRKAIVFWLTEKNISDQVLEVGIYGEHPIADPLVFYGEKGLSWLAVSELQSISWGREYLETQHVEFGENNSFQDQSCYGYEGEATLQPGESRTCYFHYSYAGDGEYLIANATKETEESFVNFIVPVEIEASNVTLTPEPESDKLPIGSLAIVEDEDGPRLAVSLESYDLVSDSKDETKKAVAMIFNHYQMGPNKVTTVSRSNKNYLENSDVSFAFDTFVEYEGEKIEEITSDTKREDRITFPNYVNIPRCTEAFSLSYSDSQKCYQLYPYLGEGEYDVSYQTTVNEDVYTTFNLDIIKDNQYMIPEMYKRPAEIVVYEEETPEFLQIQIEGTKEMPIDKPIEISKNDEVIGSVEIEDYEIISDPNGTTKEALVLFITETNLTDDAIVVGFEGEKLASTHVFYEDRNLGQLNMHVSEEVYIPYPEYEDVSLCMAPKVLEAGESRTCYQYYSFAGEGEYVIGVATKEASELEHKKLVDYKHYKLNVN